MSLRAHPDVTVHTFGCSGARKAAYTRTHSTLQWTRSNLDLFCLHRIYLGTIRARVDRHYQAFNMRRKRRSTKNPRYTFIVSDSLRSAGNFIPFCVIECSHTRYPNGIWRPQEMYDSMPSRRLPLQESTIAALETKGDVYWGQRGLSDWEVQEGREIVRPRNLPFSKAN